MALRFIESFSYTLTFHIAAEEEWVNRDQSEISSGIEGLQH